MKDFIRVMKALSDPNRVKVVKMLQRYWEMEDWSDFMANGQEGMGDPEPEADAETAAPETPQ